MAMTVGELIEELLTLDPRLPVLTSRDEEGNGYNQLHSVYTGYRAEALDRNEYIDLLHIDDIKDELDGREEDELEWWEDDYTSYDIEVVVLG
jgi:hypothetical protein